MVFKMVETDGEMTITDELIQGAYHNKNLIGPNDYTHIDKLKKLELIRAFGTIKLKPRVTVSAVLCEEFCAIPSTDIYSSEIREIFNRTNYLAEFCLFASSSRNTRFFDLLNVFCLITAQLVKKNCPDLILTVNPTYCNFYSKLFKFKKIGKEKYYDHLHNAPAQLMYGNFSDVESMDVPVSFKKTFFKYYYEESQYRAVS